MEVNWQYQMVHKYQMEGDQEPDGSQQEPDGSHLAVPDGTQVPGKGQQTPERHTIGRTSGTKLISVTSGTKRSYNGVLSVKKVFERN